MEFHKGGVQGLLQNLYRTRLSRSTQPTYSELSELQSLHSLAKKKKNEVSNLIQLKQVISQKIKAQQLIQLKQSRKKLEENNIILKVLMHIHTLDGLLQKFIINQDNFLITDEFFQNLQQKTMNLNELCQALFTFDNQLSQIAIQKKLQSSDKSTSNINQLKGKYYIKTSEKIKNFNEKIKSKMEQVEKIMEEIELPFKRNTSMMKVKRPSPQQKFIFIKILHNEACLSLIYDVLFRLSESCDNIHLEKFQSYFFDHYWQKTNKSIKYHYLSEGENHDIEQPDWLFQYLQQTFNPNFMFFQQILENEIPQGIRTQIRNYILKYNFEIFFGLNIEKRLAFDIQKMKQPFLVFNFLDETYQFQQKLSITFSWSNLDFIQRLLLKFSQAQILQRNFIHEHQWIQQKIFHDFASINYSSVKLQNLPAFNILQNFYTLFDRLYSKFRYLTDQALIEKVQGFYKNFILQLVAHIKTSYDRIYKHSGINKYEILAAYKRVEREFKSNFSPLLYQIPALQTIIQQQYYNFNTEKFTTYAMGEVNYYHKKINENLTQIYDSFSIEERLKEQQRHKIIDNFKKIHKQWQTTIKKLCEIQNFVDTKVKNYFYVYLESSQFTKEGFTLLRDCFYPFLESFYSPSNLRALIILLQQDSLARKQSLQNVQQYSFLTAQQIRSLGKIDIK